MQIISKRAMRLLGVMLLGLFAWQITTSSALAQDDVTSDNTVRTVTVSGQGNVETQPDTAFVIFSVVTEAEEAAAALSQNNEQMQAVIDALEQAGIAPEDIETQTVRLEPVFAQPGPQEPRAPAPEPEITGYRAINTIQVRVANLDQLGTIIDTAVSAGANQVQGIRFEVSNPTELLDQARADAWQDARRKAQQLAELAGAALGPALDIQATDRGVQPLVREEFALAEAARVPIRPGTQTLSSSLQVTWRLLPAESTDEAVMPRGAITVPAALIDQVVEMLSNEINVAADAIQVVSTESVDWPDAGLGCPEPGQMYAQVITPGYRVVLEANGQQYEFHTSTLPDPTIVQCENQEG